MTFADAPENMRAVRESAAALITANRFIRKKPSLTCGCSQMGGPYSGSWVIKPRKTSVNSYNRYFWDRPES